MALSAARWGAGLRPFGLGGGEYFTDVLLSLCSREAEGPQVFLENVAGPVPWEERFVLTNVKLMS